ncbi:MAG: radical SAM protein [Deltaproteobacteria bacterium]|nr:radical SAM protein [Deltaproteobacteria bacterium]
MIFDATKQAAVEEKRLWVRLTRSCNNRCAFCLDSPAHNGTYIDRELVQSKIEGGFRDGAQRLILSGGEPTIHPDYLNFISFGKSLGYNWIQTITNGRMFSYSSFTRTAVENGLNEVTVSMHGHRSELHDKLVGIKGAFEQAVKGIDNLFATKRAVVNVDVVINRENVIHLPDILEFFIKKGVREFDLLQIVPFGRGYDENREMLFYDPGEYLEYLRKAFDLRKRDGLYFWTNRFPVEYLEGYEDLIQDPHKIYDEVLGEREVFRKLFSSGEMPECLGERCNYCFIRSFCRFALEFHKTLSTGDSGRAGLDDCEPVKEPSLEGLESFRRNGEIHFRVKAFETLPEYAGAPSPDKLREISGAFGGRWVNAPPCLIGGNFVYEHRVSPEYAVSDENGVNLRELVRYFITERYFVRGMKCPSCRFFDKCEGLHINYVRKFGFSAMRPIK